MFPDAALAAQIVTVGSFSAVHGLAGWRVGYYSAPPDDVATFNNLKQSMSICTTAVSQFAARAALDDAPAWLEERRRSIAATRDAALALLNKAGIQAVKPDALPPLLIDVRGAGDDRALARRLVEEVGVLMEPGGRFGSGTAGFLRIDLTCGEDQLRSGLERAVPVLHSALEEAQR
jgi:aspartate/methionine/tyrosine aminotransferase